MDVSSDVVSYNKWLRQQSLSLQTALGVSMEKLQDLLLELQYRSESEIIPARFVTSTDISHMEDLTARLRHLATLMEVR